MLKTILLGLVVWAVGASSPQSVPRVETREALQQLVTRVEPAPPPESVAAGIGGLVVAEIVVGVNGAVESARVIAGAEALHAAASDALKKWRFKPFMRNGKPSRVLALIDLHFPDPKGDEMKRQALAGRAAQDECGQQLREQSARALEICAEALRLAEAAGSDRSQYFRPRQQYGWALINAGRFTEALPVFVRAAEDWMTGAGDSDADAADALVIVAVLHRRLGNLPQSDEVFTRAAGMFERAIVALPDFVDYRERLAAALGLHAELKREMGQADAARALIAKAEEVKRAAPPPRTSSLRVVAGVRCLCPDPPYFDEAEVIARIKVIPASTRAWLVEGEGGRSGGRALSVVYGRATQTGPGYQLGPVGFVSWRNPAMKPVPEGWGFSTLPQQWLLLTNAADPSAEVRGREDGWPIHVMWGADGPTTAEVTVGLIRFIRTEGEKAARATATVPKLTTEVQPWPIESVDGGPDTFTVTLQDSKTRRMQRVHVRRTSSGWTVASIDVI